MTEKITNLTLPEILSNPQVKVTKNKTRALFGVADWLRETILAHSMEGQRVDVTTITYRPDAKQPFTRFDVAIKNTYVTQYRLSKLDEEGFTLNSIRVSNRTYLEFIKHHNIKE